MPIFRYVCQECSAEFELLLPRFDSPAECPSCGSEKLDKALNRVGVLAGKSSKSGCEFQSSCPSGNCCCSGSCAHKH